MRDQLNCWAVESGVCRRSLGSIGSFTASFLPGLCLGAKVQWFPPCCLQQHCLETKPNNSFPFLLFNLTPKLLKNMQGGTHLLCLGSLVAVGCSSLSTFDLGTLKPVWMENMVWYKILEEVFDTGLPPTVSQDSKVYWCNKCSHRIWWIPLAKFSGFEQPLLDFVWKYISTQIMLWCSRNC